MRIIGALPHPKLKITVFKMENRITLKFENAHFEQSYKFQIMDQLQHMDDVKKLVDPTFIKEVEENFKSLNHTRVRALDRFIEIDLGDEFDTIV